MDIPQRYNTAAWHAIINRIGQGLKIYFKILARAPPINGIEIAHVNILSSPDRRCIRARHPECHPNTQSYGRPYAERLGISRAYDGETLAIRLRVK